MFGYLDINKSALDEGQRGLWQSFMCALCMSTKRQFGNIPRMFISNDVNFFNLLFHSYLKCDVTLDSKRCFSHPVRRRAMVAADETSDVMAAANVLLVYWNLYDDVVDGHSPGKKSALRSFAKHYKRARAMLPHIDAMIADKYEQLRKLEQSGCTSIDGASHCFASLCGEFCKLVLGKKNDVRIEKMCYNLGKWIYLIDALDDVGKDVKKRSYNPFVAAYGSERNIAANFADVQFEMYAVLNAVAMSYNDLNLGKYTCLLDNVVFNSVRGKTKQILTKYQGNGR